MINAPFRKRLGTLWQALDEAPFQALILNRPAYIYHLTGWLPPSWASVSAVVSPGDMVLVTPFPPGAQEPVWSQVLIYESTSLEETPSPTQNALVALEQALSQAKAIGQAVGVLYGVLRAEYVLPLQEVVRVQDATSLMYSVTAVKDEIAQAAIRERVGYLDRAFETARSTIAPGVSELSVFGAIYNTLVQALDDPLTLDCNFTSGPRAMSDLIPEPQPTNKLLAAGEVVMIDLFPQLGAYAADYTRNFVVGKPTDAQLAQHAVLEHALSVAESMLRPGVTGAQIDRQIRKTIEDAGYGEFAYRHHTGHAFGLATPEPPWLIPADHTELRAGMVVAVEPGIYHQRNGGMRLEGNYIITDGEPESLTGFPAALISCQ